nr:hypothetical protein [Tanacetum cinerariifolium]
MLSPNSIRWDYLDDVLHSFGFGLKWRSWIRGRLVSSLSINLNKSHILGVGIPDNLVNAAALSFGCSVMKFPFKYLGVRVPKSVLNTMEGIRRDFFNGIQEGHRKISWVNWSKVLAAKKYGGLGVSSFFALNRTILVKWVWRYLSKDGSLWCRVISSIHGVHNQYLFPRLFALESAKDSSVAEKFEAGFSSAFRCTIRGGAESYQLDHPLILLESVILPNSIDRWGCDLNRDGEFRV